MSLLPKFGFQIRRHEFRRSTYTQRHSSMVSLEYDALFFSAVKVADYNQDDQILY
jgi:hypothetical protein